MANGSFKIPSFQSGINEYYAEGLIKPYEAVNAINCITSEGSLKTFNSPTVKYTMDSNIHSLTAYYGTSNSTILVGTGKTLLKSNKSKVFDISGERLDFLNFEYNGKRILVGCSREDKPFMYDGSTCKTLKNRRPLYDDVNALVGYVDDNGKRFVLSSYEDALETDTKLGTIEECYNAITTYCPTGEFMELHYDRLWIAGNKDNPDRVYFSTAGVNGADIEDFTIPISEEEEINMHGGFIDVRSYDGAKIIGMKVIFNSVVIFKEKSAHKVYGSNPSNYQMVDLFSCNGAIADKSIVVGNNGAYFLNRDGIYYYDGTNTTLVSQKIKNTISKMNKNYANKSVGIYSNNKYYLAIPTGNSEVNNTLIEFDTINNSFMIYSVGNISSFLDYDYSVYYSSDNSIYDLFNSNGVPTNMYWESPNIDFGYKNARKMSEYIYFRAKGNGNIKFTLKSERKDKSIEIPLTNEEVLYKKKLKNKGRMFKLVIENVNNSSVELISPEIILEIDED